MVVLGLAGAVIGTTLGTAMILFRRMIEPWMPLIINVVLHFSSRRTHGHLTYSPAAYRWRFGSLIAAFRLVGFVPQRNFDFLERRRREFKPKYDRQELIECLRACQDRHGALSKAIIESDPAMPSVRVYQHAFGSLTQAYAEIGLKPQLGGRRRQEPQIRTYPVNPI